MHVAAGHASSAARTSAGPTSPATPWPSPAPSAHAPPIRPPPQAPIPELEALRQGPAWHQHSVRVPAEEAVPLRAPAAAFALDIELTIDRWVLVLVNGC